ncbi:MAG: C25 family cysteine peptidase [candidate division WOR-3 bacterium]
MVLIILLIGKWLTLNGEFQHSIIEDNSERIKVEVSFSGFFLDTIVINGKSYSKIIMPGAFNYLQKGYPSTPRIAKSFIVPTDKKEINFRIIDKDFINIKAPPIIPSKGNIYRSISPSSIPYYFSDFYSSKDTFPSSWVYLSKPFFMRDFKGITVYINPIRYNREKEEILALKKITIELYFEGEIEVSRFSEEKIFLKTMENIYKNFFINFSEKKLRYKIIEEAPGRMIILTPQKYLSELDSFVTWKRRKGIPTEVYLLEEIGNDVSSIKNFIKKQYDSLGITFCLLVGDGDELPPPKGTIGLSENKDADPTYAYVKGNDYYPEFFVGRFSSNGGSNLNIRKQVMRSIKYERNPEEGADWYHKGLGIASNDYDPVDSILDKKRCNWLKDTLLYNIPPYFTYTSIDSSYDPWGTSSKIASVINSGVSIINYIGHGSVNGWASGGGFSISNINSLRNYWKLPHVISVACYTGDFNGKTCFSEAALTSGTIENPTGFIVILAPTIEQSWIPPCIGQEGAINLLAHYKANTAGGVYFNGLCYMIEQCGDSIGGEIAETWHIFGDPSLQLRTDTPKKFKVTFPDTIYLGLPDHDIKVYEENSLNPVRGALVSLYRKRDNLIKSTYTDSTGKAIITFSQKDSISFTEKFYLTITHFNYKPYLDSVWGSTPIFSSKITSSITNGILEIEYRIQPWREIDFLIYDITGRNVIHKVEFDGSGESKTTKINLNNLPSGVYFLITKTNNTTLHSQKFILIH